MMSEYNKRFEMSGEELQKILFDNLKDSNNLNGVEDYPKESIRTSVSYNISKDIYVFDVSAKQGTVEE